MIDSDVNYDESALVINKEQNYFMMKKASEQKTISWIILKG